jgi:hypothetical protein
MTLTLGTTYRLKSTGELVTLTCEADPTPGTVNWFYKLNDVNAEVWATANQVEAA